MFCGCLLFVIFCFRQKTAYEVRISAWSSDVCSSDLLETGFDRRFGAVAIPMTWFQALNPIFVFALTPFLIARWRRRAEAGHDGPAIGKMAIGSALVGVSYVMLAILAHVADGQPVNWLWLVLFFGVMTLGELYILPVGLYLFDRIAPPGTSTLAIAAWYSTIEIGRAHV